MRPDASRTVYNGRLVDLVVEEWGDRKREIVESPDAVVVVAVDRDGCVTLVRQLREAARRELLELPAGGVDPGEEPLEAAKRELREEAGLTGGDWREATAFYTTPGFCRERMTLFFAEGVEQGEAAPADDEQLEVVRWQVEEIARRLDEVDDAKTLAGLLLVAAGEVSLPRR